MAWAHHAEELLWQPKDVHALVLAVAVLTLNAHALARGGVRHVSLHETAKSNADQRDQGSVSLSSFTTRCVGSGLLITAAASRTRLDHGPHIHVGKQSTIT